ncbi:hypothetical protein BX600DRAFT_510177 [Xylariales sp. PMI_506]|nr:hypothetical protein BX600DRAFT_510177 [Xylariales sp. PMI_506]
MASNSGSKITRKEVAVVLVAHKPESDFVVPERHVILTEQTPSIRIGRASKVASKGFVAARDNTWFESPVMSREHAVLRANFDTKTLYIKDVGSLHGTFRRSHGDPGKQDRLMSSREVKLVDGDRIRFGIDIYRSRETFPPCTVDVKMSWNEIIASSPLARAASTNRFVVPDDEDDDEVIADDGCASLDQTTVTMAVDLTVAEPSGKRWSQQAPEISTNKPGSDIIDLTSEPDIHGYTSDEVENSDSDDSVVWRIERTMVQEDTNSSDESEMLEEYDDMSHETESIVSERLSDSAQSCSSIHDDGISLEDYDSGDHMEGISDMDDEEIPVLGIDNHPDGHDDYPQFAELNTTFDNDEINDEPDLVSEQPNVALNVLLSPSLEVTDPCTVLTVPECLPGNVMATPSPSSPTTVSPFQTTSPTPGTASFGSAYASVAQRDRDPSPSDAAMVKMGTVWTQPAPNSSTAQVMGEKTGKYEYFAARDHNRATFGGTMPSPDNGTNKAVISLPPPPKLPQAHTQPASSHVWDTPLRFENEIGEVFAEPVASTTSPMLVSTAWTASGEAFLKEPLNFSTNHLNERTRLQSPELDMTSAATYVESKAKPNGSSVQNVRRLPIQDLLAQESKEASPTSALVQNLPEDYDTVPTSNDTGAGEGLHSDSGCNVLPRPAKRSFDEVFADDESCEGIEPITTTSTSVQTTRRLARPSASILRRLALKEGEISADQMRIGRLDEENHTALAENTEAAPSATKEGGSRPTKRLRLAQVAACAVGTFLGGAAVLAGMIATAPQI